MWDCESSPCHLLYRYIYWTYPISSWTPPFLPCWYAWIKMSYRAVNCRSSLGVASKDAGKGRCRLTSEQFKTLSIQIGWVVRIRLVFPNRQCGTDILCTSWPDSLNRVVDENVIYVDSSVQFDDGGDLIESDWMECDCKVRSPRSEWDHRQHTHRLQYCLYNFLFP